MRQLIFFLSLGLLSAAANAVILFNAGAEITVTGAFPASKETRQGGLILYLKGDPDGATIDLETQPFKTAQGPIEWIPLAECSVTVLPAVCKVAVGQGDIRLNITGGLGSPAIHAIAYEASAVVGEVGGGAGSGLVSITELSPDTIYEALSPGGTFRFRESGGVFGTDFVVTPGTNTSLDTLSGNLRVLRAGILVFETESGAGRPTIIFQDDVRVIGTPGGSTDVQFGVSNTTGFSATAAGGIFGISGQSNVFSGDTAGFRIASGLTFGPPPSATPPVACSAGVDGHLYDDTDQDLLCRCDGTTWAGVGGGATCT